MGGVCVRTVEGRQVDASVVWRRCFFARWSAPEGMPRVVSFMRLTVDVILRSMVRGYLFRSVFPHVSVEHHWSCCQELARSMGYVVRALLGYIGRNCGKHLATLGLDFPFSVLVSLLKQNEQVFGITSSYLTCRG